MTNLTPCIRCGKIRIVGKSWKETVGSNEVIYTETVCPDPECQKLVDEQLLKKKNKIEEIQKESLKRRGNNIRNKKNKKRK